MAIYGTKKTGKQRIRARRGFWLAVCACAALFLGATGQAKADWTVNNGGGVAAAPGNNAPASGTTITFDGDAILNGPLTLPNGPLNFIAASTGTTVDLQGTNKGLFNRTATGAVTINISGGDFTFFNGTQSGTAIGVGGAAGGAIQTTGAITISRTDGGTTTFSNNQALDSTASNAKSSIYGGAIYSGDQGVTLNAIGGTWYFTDNHAAGNGGAVQAGQGPGNATQVHDINVNGTVIATDNIAGYRNATTNRTGGSGGAFFAYGNISINGSADMENNHAQDFAGAMAAYGGTLSVTGDLTLKGNTANSNNVGNGGGAIFASNGVTVIGSLVADSNIDVNIAKESNGGAINSGDGSADVTVSGGVITLNNNQALNSTMNATTHVNDGNGGGVIANNIIFTPNTASTVTNNLATGNGGGLWANGSVTLNVAQGGIIFDNNVAGVTGQAYAGNGGAIYAVSGGVSATGDLTMTNNKALVGNGGGIDTVNTTSGIVTVTGNLDAEGNQAALAGGAIEAAAGTVPITGNAILKNNVASGGNGGGIDAPRGTVTVGGNLDAEGNTASLAGGAIYAASGTVPVTGSATLIGNAANGGNGGGIDAVTGTVTVGGNLIANQNNASVNGGAIYAATGPVAITGSATLTGNQAKNGNGGGVDSATSTVTVGGALDAEGNQASLAGGAIHAAAGTVTIGTNAILVGNAANGGNGGGIDAVAGTVTVGGNLAANQNNASANGGAIYAASGTVAVTGSTTLTGNQALSGNGGGIDAATGTVTVGGALDAEGNQASLAGGAIHAAAGTVTIGTDATLINNQAKNGNGGGIDAVTGTVTVGGNLVASQNTASASGGAVYAASGDVAVTGAVALTGNNATTGGGIYANNGGVTAGNGLTLTGNNATTGSGGGIYANGSVVASGPMTITNNIAATDGGAIYMALDDHDLTLSPTAASTISNNIATGNGGALYSNGNVTINAGAPVTFSNNQAGGLGGAIYIDPDVITLNANGGDITFTGNTQLGGTQHNAIYIDDADGVGDPAQLNLNANGGNIVFYDPIANNQTSGPITVTKNGAGMVSFDGSQAPGSATDYTNLTSAVYAVTNVNAGTFEVANNAIYGAYYEPGAATYVPGSDPVAGLPFNGTSFTSAAGTTVQGGIAGTIVADTMNINGNVNIAGRQPWTAAAPNYSTLTLNANTVNFGGGTIYFNTMLNEGMPNNQSDLLILNHAQTTGAAFVSVANTNGLGAYTPGDGIMLVQAVNGATTQAGMFALSGPVAAGAYEYNLFQGGVSGDPNTANNWYLRDTIAPPVPSIAPIPPTPGQPEIIFLPVDITNPLFGVMQVNNAIAANPDATIVPVPYKSVPNYRVEVPVYMAAPALADRMGLMMLGTYHERVGEDRPDDWDTETSQAVLPDGKGEPRQKSGWGRVFGMIGNVGFDKSGSNFAQNGPSYDYSMGAIQVGTDLLRGQHDNGQRDIAGLYVGMMTGHADVKKVYSGGGAGTVDMNGYSLAAYWTHKGQKEWYLDAVLQGTRYANTQAQSGRGQKIHPDGWGLAASLEAGYPFALGHGWALEPQAQMIYQWISLNNDSDQFGSVKFDDTHTWHGRVGARLTKDWTTDTGKKGSVWARANLWHSFGSTAKTTFNSFNGQNPVGMKTQLGGTWGQVGLGVDGHLSQRLTAFVNGDYNFNMGSQNGHSLGGRVGLRYQF